MLLSSSDRREPLEGGAVFVVRQIRGRFGLVGFKNLKIFDANDLVLFPDVDSVDCVAVVSDKSPAQSPWIPLL